MDMNIRSLNGERDATTFNFDPVSPVPSQELIDADYPTALKGAAANVIDPEHQHGIPPGDRRRRRAPVRPVGTSASRECTAACAARSRTRACRWTSATTTRSSTRATAPSCRARPTFALTCYNGQALSGGSRFFRGIQFTAQKAAVRPLDALRELPVLDPPRQLRRQLPRDRRLQRARIRTSPTTSTIRNSRSIRRLPRPSTVRPGEAAVCLRVSLQPDGALSTYYLSGTPLSKIGWWDGYGGPELFLGAARVGGALAGHLRSGHAPRLRPDARARHGAHPGRRLQPAQQAAGADDRPGLGEPADRQPCRRRRPTRTMASPTPTSRRARCASASRVSF